MQTLTPSPFNLLGIQGDPVPTTEALLIFAAQLSDIFGGTTAVFGIPDGPSDWTPVPKPLARGKMQGRYPMSPMRFNDALAEVVRVISNNYAVRRKDVIFELKLNDGDDAAGKTGSAMFTAYLYIRDNSGRGGRTLPFCVMFAPSTKKFGRSVSELLGYECAIDMGYIADAEVA